MEEPMFQMTTDEKKEGYGKFSLEPLTKGYGNTVGVGLRRVLLSSLPGAAVTTARFEGVRHQFTTIPGLKEDVVEFVLNLKKVRLIIESDDEEVKMKLMKKGPGTITAKDIEAPAGVTIVNPDLVLGTLADKKSTVEVELTAEKGFGFKPTEEIETNELGVIAVDAVFSPIQRVNYKVEATRVGRVTNFDKLVLEVWTDGTIDPEEAIHTAAKTLVSYFSQVYEPKVPAQKSDDATASTISDEVLKTRIEELDIPTRIVNALAKAGIETIEQIIATPKADLMKVKNLGGKSLSVVQEQLEEKGVSLQE